MKQSNKRFSSRTLRVLFHLLPRRTKRLIFLSSLSGKVAGESQLDRPTLLKLQEKFDLCNDCNAIELPLAYNDKIWGKRPIDRLVCPIHLAENNSDHGVTRTAREIVAKMPCYLVYGETLRIVGDVRELLNSREELFHGQPQAQ